MQSSYWMTSFVIQKIAHAGGYNFIGLHWEKSPSKMSLPTNNMGHEWKPSATYAGKWEIVGVKKLILLITFVPEKATYIAVLACGYVLQIKTHTVFAGKRGKFCAHYSKPQIS